MSLLSELPLDRLSRVKNLEEVKDLTQGSSKKAVLVECSSGHKKLYSPKEFVKAEKLRCPICSNRELLEGFNDLWTHLSDSQRNSFDFSSNPDPTKTLISSTEPIVFNCEVYSEEWVTKPFLIKQLKNDCGVCVRKSRAKELQNRRNVTTLQDCYPELAAYWSKQNYSSFDEISVKSRILAQWVCPQCNESWSNRVGNQLQRKNPCLNCSTKEDSVAIKLSHLIDEWVDNEAPEKVYSASKKPRAWRCSQGHIYQASPFYRARGMKCTVCSDRSLLTGVNDLKSISHPIIVYWAEENKVLPHQVFRMSKDIIAFNCPDCSHKWEEAIATALKRTAFCPKCNLGGTSHLEREITAFVRTIVPSVQIASRKIIKPYELDLFVESSRVAIEVNGTYWHSNKAIKASHGLSAKDYHEMKKDLCAKRGIKLAFVWEDDWKDRREEVEEALAHFLRKCELTPLLTRLTSVLDEE